MPRHAHYVPHGVIPAVLLPFNDDLSHRRKRASAATCATWRRPRGFPRSPSTAMRPRFHACSFDEQQQILAASLAEVGDKVPPHQRNLCRRLDRGRTDCERWRPGKASHPRCSSFRPTAWRWAAICGPTWRSRITAASPTRPTCLIIAFQYPMAKSHLGFTFDTLLALFEKVPTICGRKGLVRTIRCCTRRHIRTFQNLPRPVNVLTDAFRPGSWPSLTLGCRRPALGLRAASSPDLQVALFRAVQAGRPQEGADT